MSYRFSPVASMDDDMYKEYHQRNGGSNDSSPLDGLVSKKRSLAVCPPDAESDVGPGPGSTENKATTGSSIAFEPPTVGGFMLPPPQIPIIAPPMQPLRPVFPGRRDPNAIRQQYMANLGIDESRRALQRESARRQAATEGIKVKLKGSDEPLDAVEVPLAGGIFARITSWYGGARTSEEKAALAHELAKEKSSTMKPTAEDARIAAGSGGDEEDDGSPADEMIMSQESSADDEKEGTDDTAEKGSPSSVGRRVQFNKEAKVILIPKHTEYSQIQRERLWHTREEFVSMVERNVDEMYIEMEREYEAQLQQQQQQQLDEEKLEEQRKKLADQNLGPTLYDPGEQQQRLVRNQHQIRQQYLKQLGIGASLVVPGSPS